MPETNAPTPAPQAPAPAPKPAAAPVKPATPAAGVAPLKIAKEEKKKGGSLIWGCGLGLVGLFTVFIILMIVVISQVGPDTPVMRAFGLNPEGLRQFLVSSVSLFFGFFSLLFFVLTLIGIFRWAGAKKGDKEAKSRGVRMTLLSVIPMFLMLFAWFFLTAFINRLEIAAEKVVAEIVVLQPEELENLQAPLSVTFTSDSVIQAIQQNDLSIEFIRWDLDGDGVFETVPSQKEVTRLYNNRGIVNVGLQVKVVDEAAPRLYTKTLNIANAVFAAEPSVGIPPLEVSFDATNLIPEGPKVKSFDWDFNNDGKYDVEGQDRSQVSYTFEAIGTYQVNLRILDELNNVQTFSREIEVLPSDTPVLSAVIDALPGRSGVIPLQLQLDGGNSRSLKGTIVNYEWSFGDGSDTQYGKTVTHAFTEAGKYNVTLTVTDSKGQKASETIEISAQLNASAPEPLVTTEPAAIEGVIRGEIPLKIMLDASKSTDADRDIENYEWDFMSDGTVDQAGSKTVATYDQPGNYMLTLNIKDREGNVGTYTLKVEATEPGVKAVISASPVEGSVPLIVEFDGSSSSAYGGKIVSYEWDFGDKSPKTITGAKINHKYTAIGSYTAKLKVTSNQGKTAETSTLIYVRDIPLLSCFKPSRNNGTAPLSVNFDSACSGGAISVYSWDFGDGTASNDRKPTHTFEKPGTYTVTLEVADDKSNVSTVSDVIVVEGILE